MKELTHQEVVPTDNIVEKAIGLVQYFNVLDIKKLEEVLAARKAQLMKIHKGVIVLTKFR